eukprot:g1352.t1
MSEKSTSFPDYVLSAELKGHEGEVRAVCMCADGSLVTASQDNCVRRWANTGGHSWTDTGQIFPHIDWVTALVALPPGLVRNCPQGGFATGSLDRPLKKAGECCPVRIFNLSGTEVMTLRGHTQGVVSLALTANGQLVSGSWDGTARVWNLDEEKCTHVLKGHENAVQVLALPNGNVATGSSGATMNDDKTRSDCKLRIWSLDTPETGRVVNVHTDHLLYIRSLCNARGFDDLCFMSGAGDAKIVLRSLDGSVLQEFDSSLYSKGEKADGVLSIACGRGNEFISSSLDDTVRIWRDGKCVQHIPHPGTPWDISFCANGDFVSVCGDKVVRIWTRDKERHADESVQNALREAVLKRATGGPKLNPSDYPSVDDLEAGKVSPPASEGGVHLFSKNDKIFAYLYSATDGYVLQGEVTGTKGDGGDSSSKKMVLDGKEWDRIIDLDLDEGKILRLPFNWTDNPYDVAAQFSAKHGLPSTYEERIGNYIADLQAKEGVTFEVKTGDFTKESQGKGESRFFPPATCLSYTSKPKSLDAMMKKFIEFNTLFLGGVDGKRKREDGSNPAMGEKEMGLLSNVVDVLKDTSRYHASTLDSNNVTQLVMELLKNWPIEQVFPVFDLIRAILCHPGASECICSMKNIMKLVVLMKSRAALQNGDGAGGYVS